MFPPLPENCRPIKDFPGYCVSIDGVVYSCRSHGGKIVAWRPMKHTLSRPGNAGRIHVSLHDNRRKNAYQTPVHKLVLEAFVGPRPEGMEACHSDGNSLNNHASNLRWDTHLNNMADRTKHGTGCKWERVNTAVLNRFQVQEIRTLYASGSLQKDLAKRFGVNTASLSAICRGKTWKNLPSNP